MRRLFAALGLCVMLVACSATIPAPIQDDSVSFLSPKHVYRVLPGDTLYSIAFVTDHDYRQLARWNGIRPPYRIEAGENIALQPPRVVRGHSSSAPAKVPIRRGFMVAPGRVHRIPQRLGVARALSPRLRSRARPPLTPNAGTARIIVPTSWIWPAQGRVEQTFGRGPLSGRPGNRGIDIIGHAGEAIRAAAAGRVVYIGGGLPGYGKLIIIKQNNDYLSAYAHNAHIDVKEGEVVRQGQVIATMGNSGTNRVELEFEIRRRGIPVNPVHYLPMIHR